MISVTRDKNNPFFLPQNENDWEKEAAFNCSVIYDNSVYHMLYRAISGPMRWQDRDTILLSSIGYAKGDDGTHFSNRRQFIKPEYEWEKFGCEDPRVTKLDGKYYIFYTAISSYPPNPESIKVALATTHDFQQIEQKRLVTSFNAKAMSLFPEKINGKLCAVITVDTDYPPAKIGIVYFDDETQIWNREHWDAWKLYQGNHIIPLQRDIKDHIEVGAQPIKTDRGWLLLYCYIKNYLSHKKIFGIEAVLLAPDDPLKVIGRSESPLLQPSEYYEIYGNIPNVIFPSGAIVQNDVLSLYYGATDTTCCVATVSLSDLLDNLLPEKIIFGISQNSNTISLVRFEGNPIIAPDTRHTWDSKAVLNPAVTVEDEKVHILYRAMGIDDTSVIGYATSSDGLHIDEKLEQPIYTPTEKFELKKRVGNSGCEDPRLTKIDDTYYMLYTAFDGITPRIALATISVDDFRNRRWNWSKPRLISSPGVSNKDAAVFPEKINGKYGLFHRIEPDIWIDFSEDLVFNETKWVAGSILCSPRPNMWDDLKIGVGTPPIKTDIGWLIIYHGISSLDQKYRLGILILDLVDPTKVILRLNEPILEPEASFENKGMRPGTVFSCGGVVLRDQLFVYYGASDELIGVARIDYPTLLSKLKSML